MKKKQTRLFHSRRSLAFLQNLVPLSRVRKETTHPKNTGICFIRLAVLVCGQKMAFEKMHGPTIPCLLVW